MVDLEILKGKRILAVDDEPDVPEIIQEELVTSKVTTATSFEAAKELILTKHFDLIILDIMGVNGFALLELSRTRNIPAVMLTAHSITVESVNKAIKMGAVSFLPKDELVRIQEAVAEILDDLSQGRTHWKRLFDRLGPFFEERLGLSWEDLEKPRVPPYSY